MSGGVDSSVAAAILKKEGYQVIGVTMHIWPSDNQARDADNYDGCCGASAVADARRVAHMLGIPHYVMDFKEVFARKVIDNFRQEYVLGRTPNPCIRCNHYVKFDALLDRAKGLGADFVATGHHARVTKNGNEDRYLLKKGIDRHKDQSYVLYSLTQQQLKHILLPVGDFTKERVREIAGDLRLPVAAKAESQEICFIPDNDYPKFLKEYTAVKAKPGPILDRRGNIIGQHRGIPFYTIGQRKGLGIAARDPLYVTAIDPESNAIVVGSKAETYGDELIASGLNWISPAGVEQPLTARARIRYLHREAEADITPLDIARAHVKFREPQMAIAPGQAIVFYDGDKVIGGGTIEQERK